VSVFGEVYYFLIASYPVLLELVTIVDKQQHYTPNEYLLSCLFGR